MAAYQFRAPALPIPTAEYEQGQQFQFHRALRLYFNLLDNYNVAASTPPHGTTADRPTLNLQIGQFYFDTTLGYPIWWKSPDWVNASGIVV